MALSWKENCCKVGGSCYHRNGLPVEKFKFNTLLPPSHLQPWDEAARKPLLISGTLTLDLLSYPSELQQVSLLYELPSPGALLYSTKLTKNRLCFYQHSRCLSYPLRPRLSLQLSVVPFKSSSESLLAVHLQQCRHAPACTPPLFQPLLGALSEDQFHIIRYLSRTIQLLGTNILS